MSRRDHHFPCPCGAELADECPRCNQINPFGSMRFEPASASAHTSVQPELAVIRDRGYVLSPTYDAILVEASIALLNGLRADGNPPQFVADYVAKVMADEVALHGRRAA